MYTIIESARSKTLKSLPSWSRIKRKPKILKPGKSFIFKMEPCIIMKYGIDRLVEDLIQESMARGDFENLSGKGKPLSKKMDHHNPYVDLVTHKINQVMIENGFTPEWITLQKEIREEKDIVWNCLRAARKQLGPAPLSDREAGQWQKDVDNCRTAVIMLNKKINHFNLVVPLLQKQMLLFNLEKESEHIFKEGEFRTTPEVQRNVYAKNKTDEQQTSLLSTFSSMFGF
uniref:DnaJ homologue subfamily C member 28 conserved domain-containing protein n=1 Tax=Clastoptera arizonana TaxID=38151 RepID=A0A1B6D2U3_9HEMI